MSDAVIGHGTLFHKGNGASPEVFATMGEVTAISGPSTTVNTVDATHFSSPSAYQEFIAGLVTPGEVSITFNATAALVATLKTDLNARAVRNYRIVEAYGSPEKQWDFAAIMTSMEFDRPIGDKVSVTANFTISGVTTLT